MKLPPREKIPEAWSALVDGRVTIDAENGSAKVVSSDGAKTYDVFWRGNTYYSNDNATYWQSYPGYPILAILMKQGRLPYNPKVANLFKGIDWHLLNNQTKRDYHESLEHITDALPLETQKEVDEAMNTTYDQLKNLNLTLTRKKSLFTDTAGAK